MDRATLARLRHAARHEAAHAVTAVRLGLPLKYTDTIEHMDRGGRTKLLRAATAANLEAHATVAAAGVVAEGDRRARFWEVPFTAPSAHDIGVLVLVAQRLGLVGPDSAYELGGLPEDDPAFGPWATAARRRAREILRRDRGAAWRRVTAALVREHRLSGATVQALVSRAAR